MERFIKEEFGLSKKMRWTLTIGSAIFLLFTILACVGMYNGTKKVIVNQVTGNIKNISKLNEDSISRSIENRKLLLEMIAGQLRLKQIGGEDAVDRILYELEGFKSAYNFYDMGIVDETDTFYMTGKRVLDGADFPYMDEIRGDVFCMTESFKPLDGGKFMVNMMSIPLTLSDGTEYLLVAMYYTKNLTGTMNTVSLEDDSYTFLVDANGKVVLFPRYYEDEAYNRLMQYVNDVVPVSPDTDGNQTFTYDDELYYAHFEKMDMNNWYLMTCARESDVFADVKVIVRNSFFAIGFLWMLIIVNSAVVSVYMYHSNTQRRELVYYDKLLHIGNVNSLSVLFRHLPKDVLESMYLVVFDIDKFKEFNYLYGEEGGDDLLRYIAGVFQKEYPDVYLFRYYSDFFIFLSTSKNKAEFEERIDQLLDRFTRDIEARVIPPFEVSAGVRKIECGEPLQRMISDALMARGTIKGNHLCHHAFYDETLRKEHVRYMEIESDFARALREKEFRVYYQPKYDIRTGEIIGAEALTRWVKADGTIVSPGDFIPCFEKSRQIIMLDEYMLKEVCRQIKEMEDEGLAVKPVSVNLSRVNMRHPDILPNIASIIKDSGIDPAHLDFEITESALLEEGILVKAIITYLHKLGCRVDMDDYGVGASNPDSLITNNFDVLKLDKSFIDRIGDERAEDLIRTTTHLAMKWGMEVLAEGVEEKYQAERLVELGCVYAQGFYYSRPIPEPDYRALLRAAKHSDTVSADVSQRARNFPEDICALLDGNLLPTYIIDPECFTVMYCNKAFRKYLRMDPTGCLCYEKIRGCDAPCASCAAMRLYRDGDSSPKEIRTPFGGKALLQTSTMRWQGRQYIQLTFIDTTMK